MKHQLLALTIFIVTFPAFSQDSLMIDYEIKKEASLAIAYNYSFAEPNDKNYHLLELRLQKQRFGGQHPILVNYNTGLIVGLNTDQFLISPVIGGVIGYGMLIIGLDLTYFTDFDEGTLRLIPYLGIGYQQFRLSLNPHVRLTNTNYEPINRGHVNLTIKLFKLTKNK